MSTLDAPEIEAPAPAQFRWWLNFFPLFSTAASSLSTFLGSALLIHKVGFSSRFDLLYIATIWPLLAQELLIYPLILTLPKVLSQQENRGGFARALRARVYPIALVCQLIAIGVSALHGQLQYGSAGLRAVSSDYFSIVLLSATLNILMLETVLRQSLLLSSGLIPRVDGTNICCSLAQLALSIVCISRLGVPGLMAAQVLRQFLEMMLLHYRIPDNGATVPSISVYLREAYSAQSSLLVSRFDPLIERSLLLLLGAGQLSFYGFARQICDAACRGFYRVVVYRSARDLKGKHELAKSLSFIAGGWVFVLITEGVMFPHMPLIGSRFGAGFGVTQLMLTQLTLTGVVLGVPLQTFWMLKGLSRLDLKKLWAGSALIHVLGWSAQAVCVFVLHSFPLFCLVVTAVYLAQAAIYLVSTVPEAA